MTIWQGLFGFDGRIRRSSYIASLIGISVAQIAVCVAMVFAFNGGKWPVVASGADAAAYWGPWVVGWLVMLPFIIWSHLALGVKRCHDRGYPGIMLLVGFIPILGWLWALIDLWFIDGTAGPNRYGPSPKGTQPSAPQAPIYAQRMDVTLDLPVAVPPTATPITQDRTKPQIQENASEDAIWAEAARELETGTINQGLWTRLLVHNDGDEAKTKLAYIKARVETLKAEAKAEVQAAKQAASERAEAEAVADAKARGDLQIDQPEARHIEESDIRALGSYVSAYDMNEMLNYGITITGRNFYCRGKEFKNLHAALQYARITGR